jgi:signal peptidase I
MCEQAIVVKRNFLRGNAVCSKAMRLLKRQPRSDGKPADRRYPVTDWTVQILILLFGFSSIGWTYVVPTGSMEKTVLVGDHMIVDRLVYAEPGPVSRHLLPYSPVKRGDIIVFAYPLDPKTSYVKRAIGLPGDRIHIVDKMVYVNGKALDEPYKQVMPFSRSRYADNFPNQLDVSIYPRGRAMLEQYVREGELIVPAGHYFAMGDNRDNSDDSRFWGLVPHENLIGKPVLIFWSYEATTEQLNSRTHWIDAALHFFSKTRWDRTMRLVRGYEFAESER